MNGKEAYELMLARSEPIDRQLVSLFEGARSHLPQGSLKITLIAQGGYGRRELSRHSDIDLLILYDGKELPSLKSFTEKLLHPLWDLGLEVGFATRTVSDCRQLMQGDMTILSSLIDARYLAGDRGLFQDFEKMKGEFFSRQKERNRFFRNKMREDEERWNKYGGSVYLLEPHIKEGAGGLRDYHTLYWFARVIYGIKTPRELGKNDLLSENDCRDFWRAINFLWAVREELHRLGGRRQDQLLL
ncbi:MAG: [protein-PII] uridylyltransferase, partial [Deltaproteobacteria bacterium]|nr:[protein-PII] uridylyltransferase [Deltaproteobacteria bacterium]